jgi:hypothetical protein
VESPPPKPTPSHSNQNPYLFFSFLGVILFAPFPDLLALGVHSLIGKAVLGSAGYLPFVFPDSPLTFKPLGEIGGAVSAELLFWQSFWPFTHFPFNW